MPTGGYPYLEELAPTAVKVLHEHPGYDEVFPIADVVDQVVRAAV